MIHRTPDDLKLIFTGHALRQMFARAISSDDVRRVVTHGVTIAQYADDKPYPSRLILGFVGDRPIHVVLAYNEAESTGYVVTAYEPTPDLWHEDFKTRKNP